MVSIDTIEGIAIETSRIESREEVSAFLSNLKYLLNTECVLNLQLERMVDKSRPVEFTNTYTIADLFPDSDPVAALKSELKSLSVSEYMRTVKDLRFPERSEMREFGRKYRTDKDVYIKIRVELLPEVGQAPIFVMSFHYAMFPFSAESFPYSD